MLSSKNWPDILSNILKDHPKPDEISGLVPKIAQHSEVFRRIDGKLGKSDFRCQLASMIHPGRKMYTI